MERVKREKGLTTQKRVAQSARHVLQYLTPPTSHTMPVQVGVVGGLQKEILKSGQNLHELLPRDIQCYSRSAVPNRRGRACHGSATKHREQTEFEGTHASVAVCPIVRRATY
jgi:hypothetical protein